MSNNKEADLDWFRLESNKEGTKWFGKCWYIHNLLKYEFDVEFDVSLSYQGKVQILRTNFPTDTSNISRHSTRNCASGIGREDSEDVPRRKDLPH